MTLRELAQSLSFEHAREHLPNIRLGDVLRHSQTSALPATSPSGARNDTQVPKPGREPQVPAKTPRKERRKRRGAQEMEALRAVILERLRATMGATTTVHLCQVLQNGGHDVDILQMNRLLGQLEEQGYVTCLGGKPKGWRLKPAGRTAPEPMQIRRAADVPAPTAEEAV